VKAATFLNNRARDRKVDGVQTTGAKQKRKKQEKKKCDVFAFRGGRVLSLLLRTRLVKGRLN